MEMTEADIARDYRLAKNKNMQIGILADRNCTSRERIIDILLEKGENIVLRKDTRGRKKKREILNHTDETVFQRLDDMDEKIVGLEKEYRKLAADIKGV